MIKKGDIVTLDNVPDEAMKRSGGRMQKYIGHAALVVSTVDSPESIGGAPIAIEFRDGQGWWVTTAMLRK